MSLTYSQIEEVLTQGLSFHNGEKDFVAKADPKTDDVIISEMTALNRTSLPLELIVDRAHANEAGSDLTDVAALRKLLAELSSEI